MYVLAQIVRGIAMVVLLSVCLELLLPKSSLRPYIRTVTGLLLIVAVLTPLRAVDLRQLPQLFSAAETRSEDMAREAEAMQADWLNEARLQAAAQSAAAAESLLLLDSTVSGAQAEAYYEEERLRLRLRVRGSEDRSEKWRQTLAAYSEAEAVDIEIEFVREE